MIVKRQLPIFALLVAGMAAAITWTGPYLVAHTKFGLEFRGGYEIQYVATSLQPERPVTHDELLATTVLLRHRADMVGMAEPEISIEGKNRIRLKIAGVATADQVRSILGDSSGLPVKLTEKYTQTVGSVLGNSALKETLTGGAVGLMLIGLLLVLLYRVYGVVAALCLAFYLWLLLVVFNALHATLSLSAIVAFVLGVGMAADASIIWFERVVEEFRRSRDLVASLKDGFRASFQTICDANLATAIAMLALFLVGIGPIQGFSLTMLLSMALSVATSLFLVGALCGLLTRGSRLPPGLLFRACPKTVAAPIRSFDFVKWGYRLAILSVLVMGIGLYSYERHGMNLDIDFTAGTALDIDLDQATDQAATEQVMENAGIVPATIIIGGNRNNHIAARFDEILKPEELNTIIAAFKTRYGPKVEYEENTADPGTSREFALKAGYAILVACGGILLFIGLRFSWAMALTTFVTLIHDMLIVSAIFAIFKFEIDVTYVAAMLTVMGYSLNDKIVIFSRVRENLRSPAAPESLRVLVNRSIRQTLGRSIYTVLTVVLAAASLLLLGCEPLQMFSLAILLGLASGAYSSIFLASALWLLFTREPRRNQRAEPLVTLEQPKGVCK